MKMLEQSSQFHAWEIAMKKNIRITKAAIWVLTAVCIALCLFGPETCRLCRAEEGHLFAGGAPLVDDSRHRLRPCRLCLSVPALPVGAPLQAGEGERLCPGERGEPPHD